jgi:hypothetical protein
MRIRVLGRVIAAFAILTLFLCLLPGSTHVAVAKPFPNPPDTSPTDPTPKGDNDGVVLKAGGIRSNSGYATDQWGTGRITIASGGSVDLGALRGYYAWMMLRYWSFWLR